MFGQSFWVNLLWLLVWHQNFIDVFIKNPSSLIKHFRIEKKNNLLSRTTWKEIIKSKRN